MDNSEDQLKSSIESIRRLCEDRAELIKKNPRMMYIKAFPGLSLQESYAIAYRLANKKGSTDSRH